jgi:hypothetical protein
MGRRGVCLRRHWLYIRGTFSFTHSWPARLSNESAHQVSKLQKIRHTEDRAPLAEDRLRVRRDGIRPLPRHRAGLIFVDAQQKPRAVTIVPLAHADELLSAERVERVRHTHKTCSRVRKTCILS